VEERERAQPGHARDCAAKRAGLFCCPGGIGLCEAALTFQLKRGKGVGAGPGFLEEVYEKVRGAPELETEVGEAVALLNDMGDVGDNQGVAVGVVKLKEGMFDNGSDDGQGSCSDDI